MNEKQEDYFDDIATHLMSVRGPATLHHLNKLAPGAFEALASKVPALRDPRKGGRRDIDFVRNRTLTPEVFHGLALAWDQWLFMPGLIQATAPAIVTCCQGPADVLRKDESGRSCT